MVADVDAGLLGQLLNLLHQLLAAFPGEGGYRQADDPAAALARFTAEYQARFAHPYAAAARGYVDDVIDPRDTRPRLIDALRSLAGKRDRNPAKKHGNIPL